MQPKLKPRRAIAWALPVVVWIVSVSILLTGVLVDDSLIGVGLVMIVTSAVCTAIAVGGATAVMEVHRPE